MALGYITDIDGSFGQSTESTLRAYQSANG
ncbi:hypothetical protein CSV67_00205 [Sporosarcina sp. P2]|nr:hypothetical protein CSV67_00205 [Sporosarcina sp. P2]